jgi:predicted nuclease of predicted toxin-antitoxin system
MHQRIHHLMPIVVPAGLGFPGRILAHGLNDDHAIITLDSDFHTLLALSNRHKPSVVRIRREGLRGAALANLLVSVWTSVGQAIVHGAMVTVTESNIRVRYLPIGGDAA